MTRNEDLVKLIQDGVDVQENMSKLWQQNIGIIHNLAKTYARDSFELEDLQQESFFALQTAAERYDDDCGARFSTYLFIHLNSRIRRYLAKTRATLKTPINIVDKITKYNKLKKQLQMELNTEPSDDMIRVLMGISQKQLADIKKAARETQSLDETVADDESRYTKIPDPHDRIEELINDIAVRQLSDHLWSMVDKLKPREKDIIEQVYLQNKTCADIAKAEGVSRSRIDDIKHKALKKMKAYPESRKLEAMAMDVYGIGTRGVTVSAFQRTWTSATEYAAFRLLELEK